MAGEYDSKCWICGHTGSHDNPLSREHIIKRTDLKMIYGDMTEDDPVKFYRQTERGDYRKKPVKSLDSKTLKHTCKICQTCNGARTSDHDKAWEVVSQYIRTHSWKLRDELNIRGASIFPFRTSSCMKDMHLYFVKLFGCRAIDDGVPIDVQSFASSILNERIHPHIYLSLCFTSGEFVGGTPTYTKIGDNGLAQSASWFLCLGHVHVNIIYAADGKWRRGLDRAWNPKYGSNVMRTSNLDLETD